jgi:hypothetical protein
MQQVISFAPVVDFGYFLMYGVIIRVAPGVLGTGNVFYVGEASVVVTSNHTNFWIEAVTLLKHLTAHHDHTPFEVIHRQVVIVKFTCPQ